MNYFPINFTETMLLDVFRKFGNISLVENFRHYAFVQFERREDGLQAMKCLNEKYMFGATLKVSPARRPHFRPPPVSQPQPVQRGSTGFLSANVPSGV